MNIHRPASSARGRPSGSMAERHVSAAAPADAGGSSGRQRANDPRRDSGGSGRSVLRDQSRPVHGRHRTPLRAAWQSFLASAPRCGLHTRGGCIPGSRTSCSRSVAARRIWWPGPQRPPQSSTMRSFARAGDGSRAKSAAIVRCVVAIVGLGAYRVAFGRPRATLGLKPRRLRAPRCGCCRIPAA